MHVYCNVQHVRACVYVCCGVYKRKWVYGSMSVRVHVHVHVRKCAHITTPSFHSPSLTKCSHTNVNIVPNDGGCGSTGIVLGHVYRHTIADDRVVANSDGVNIAYTDNTRNKANEQ